MASDSSAENEAAEAEDEEDNEIAWEDVYHGVLTVNDTEKRLNEFVINGCYNV